MNTRLTRCFIAHSAAIPPRQLVNSVDSNGLDRGAVDAYQYLTKRTTGQTPPRPSAPGNVDELLRQSFGCSTSSLSQKEVHEPTQLACGPEMNGSHPTYANKGLVDRSISTESRRPPPTAVLIRTFRLDGAAEKCNPIKLFPNVLYQQLRRHTTVAIACPRWDGIKYNGQEETKTLAAFPLHRVAETANREPRGHSMIATAKMKQTDLRRYRVGSRLQANSDQTTERTSSTERRGASCFVNHSVVVP